MRFVLAALLAVRACCAVGGVPGQPGLSTDWLLEDLLSASRRILEPEIQPAHLQAIFSTQVIAELRHRAYNLDEIGA